MKFDWTQGALAEGLRLYQEGEFFAAHETWESVWLELQQPEKMFLQGLIQVTAAFYHLQRNNPLGTALLLRDVANAINGLTEFLRLERKRVPGRILSEADRLECLFFGGFDPHFEGDEPPGL